MAVDDLVDVEVRLRGRLTAQRECLVGHAHKRGVCVRFRVHGNAGDTFVACSADHSDGNLAPVGDQNLRDPASVIGHLLSSSVNELLVANV